MVGLIPNSRKANVPSPEIWFVFLDSPRDYWGVRNRIFSFQNLLDFSERKRTNVFSVLLDCSISEQPLLRIIVFDHPRLIRSDLICRRRAPMRFRWRTVPWTQLNVNMRPHNSTAHVFQVHWCMKRANMPCICWTPFISSTIISATELRALLPTSCMQFLSPTFIAHLWRCSDRGGKVSCSYVFNPWRNISGDTVQEFKHRNQNIGDMGTSNIMKEFEFAETFIFGRFYSNLQKLRNRQNTQKRTEILVVRKVVCQQL